MHMCKNSPRSFIQTFHLCVCQFITTILIVEIEICYWPKKSQNQYFILITFICQSSHKLLDSHTSSNQVMNALNIILTCRQFVPCSFFILSINAGGWVLDTGYEIKTGKNRFTMEMLIWKCEGWLELSSSS